MAQPIGSTDERLPLARLVPLGLQHVLVMYAGAIAVPLIIGRALKLPPEQVALLINADLFLLRPRDDHPVARRHGLVRHPAARDDGRDVSRRSGRWWRSATNPGLGITGIFGAVIGAGIVSMLIAPFVSRMLPLFSAGGDRDRPSR
jgi:NCS2 family nucleobase:cation symporter-2